MQLIDDVIHCGRVVKITTVNGTYSGPMEIRVHEDTVQCRRDIERSWTKIPSDTVDIKEISDTISSWIDSGPPRDQDGRIIPVQL